MSVIKVNNLTAGYTHRKRLQEVLKGVSFEIHSGELVCLMGPNGSGKSTLLRSITGLQSYQQGDIEILDKPLSQIKAHTLAGNISIVLTDSIISGYMTVRELISLGRYPHMSWILKFTGEDQEIIDRTAQECGVDHLMNKYVYELSDGQRQKVLIARALAQDAPIMVLDEPTSHLDLNNRVEVINLLKRLSRQEDKAIIMATHELDLALQMADRLLLLNYDGKLHEGIPEDLVLNGKLDRVFSFKGYDLKTGRVEHFQTGKKIGLKGQGHLYLWTKNALEREGYTIDAEATNEVTVNNGDHIKWQYRDASFHSIEHLISFLRTNY